MFLYVGNVHREDGVEYTKTHDIDQLIRVARENEVDLRLPQYVDDHTEMLSQWEAESRCVIGSAVERTKAERALAEVDDYRVAIVERERQQIANGEG